MKRTPQKTTRRAFTSRARTASSKESPTVSAMACTSGTW
jgi:hypothetical protein